jgi:hypothetical protein
LRSAEAENARVRFAECDTTRRRRPGWAAAGLAAAAAAGEGRSGLGS